MSSSDGRVEVTQTTAAGGEPRVLRQMGAGEFFGEIGLLSGVPRTATVTAVTDGTLVAARARASWSWSGRAGLDVHAARPAPWRRPATAGEAAQ